MIACMFLPFIVVAVVSSGDDDEQDNESRGQATTIDLLSPEATLRDYRNASAKQQDRFLAYFTRARIGEAEPVAMSELRRHLKSRFASLPARGNQTELLVAAAGKTKLWDAAEYAAENLGWPQR